MSRPVAGGEAPYVPVITGPAQRIGVGIGVLCQCRAAAILEIVESDRTHRGIVNPPEIDPHLAVLMTKHRCEGESPKAPLTAPEARIGLGPCLPAIIRGGVPT